jgi:hypothetical protein
MAIINIICKFYDIKEGHIELACDGLSAFNRAFPSDSGISIQDPNYDLIAAIHKQRLTSRITWQVRHVKGHQDETMDIHLLDQWRKLNIEVDKLANEHLQIAANTPRHYKVAKEPWSLWIGGEKITKNVLSTIYDRVHSVDARCHLTA